MRASFKTQEPNSSVGAADATRKVKKSMTVSMAYFYLLS